MNLGALARSLSNSLGFGIGSKKQLESQTASETPTATASSSLKISDELLIDPQTQKEIVADSSSPRRRRASTRTIRHPKNHPPRPLYKQQVEEILLKISELEHTLYENQQQEFDLRMALEQQAERINELDFSLDTEKMRNQRLVHLLRGIDTDSPSDSEPETEMLNGLRLQSSAGEVYGSISPLLMQQRYDELSTSHRHTNRQLAKKEKAMKLLKCDLEELRGKYDSLLDDYRSEQGRLEAVCSRYLHLQQKKKSQICMLKETLGYASECILHAQLTIESCTPCDDIDLKHLATFNLNLESFMRALRNCCSMRKLQVLEQQQGLDVDAELLQQRLESAAPPSVGISSNCTDQTPSTVRRQRKRHKH